MLKRLAPNYCKTVGIDQGELEDRANLEKRIAEQDKEIKELKRQAQEARETDSQAKKPRLAPTDNDAAASADYFSCTEYATDADATPTEGLVSCEQGVVKEESQTESKSEPESAKEESESESETKQEYAQKSYGCMRTEPGDCTRSVVQADGQNAVQADGQKFL